ncbi:MAG: tellurite resistance TerB family protein [Desulfofustis sp.]|jgi:uncharacterized membrane protein YebE (DUF533 family)|nr:tellurite resistance TerB family protein [Desulfofustis sp.]
MAGFMDILGTMMQQGMAQSGGKRMSSALGGRSGLEDLLGGLGQMMGGARTGQAPAAAASGGMLGDVLGQLANNKVAVGGLGALAGALLGGGGSAARGAIGGGGLAMLASLAFSSLQKAGQPMAQAPRALLEPQNEEERQTLENDAEVIVKAMINAAKADGRIDQREVEKIIGKLQEGGLTAEEKEFFLTETKKAGNLKDIAASVGDDIELAAEVYAASLLAIEVDTEAERAYLKKLAGELGLNSRITDHIERTLGVAV